MLAAPQGSRRSDHPASKSDVRMPGTGHRTEITFASWKEENLEDGICKVPSSSQRAQPKQQECSRWGEGSFSFKK